MFSRDPELALQFYRENVADEELCEPAPASLGLRALLSRLVTQLQRAGNACVAWVVQPTDSAAELEVYWPYTLPY